MKTDWFSILSCVRESVRVLILVTVCSGVGYIIGHFIAKFWQGEMNKILFFREEFFFLSNFWRCDIELGGRVWPSAEHLYQASKTLIAAEQREILFASTPWKAKRMGREVTLRPDWETSKISFMREIVTAKFQQHPDLMERLRATGEAEIIEGNTWHDNFWGDCFCSKCDDIAGENWLGRILMEVRG